MTKALTLVNPTNYVIKLDDPAPAMYSASGFTVVSDVTIDARNAIIKRVDSGPILTINDKAVTILGGAIQGATGSNGDGILCDSNARLTIDGTTIEMSEKSAVNVTGGCKLTVTNAMLRNNNIKGGFVASVFGNGDLVTLSRSWLLSNRGGGVLIINGAFVIVGNVFWSNGTSGATGSPIGGVSISTSMAMSNRLEFNTIAYNQAQIGTKGPGIDCTAGTFVARNNIIWENRTDVLGDQIGGSCKHSYSDIQQTLGSANDGGNNLLVDPLFQSAIDLHVQTGSPVHQRADPNADLTGIASKDIDGQVRKAPADIGADQLK